MGTIRVAQLGKAYKQYPTRWARLREWLLPMRGPRHQLRWILQDINFEVKAGEAVGLIGINGAGKSTLLKLITGTTQPTTGSVALTGRVAALLELGMGFHPDFTGRQNVYMAGQLAGLTVQQLDALMPSIEQFAEIGDYIEQPVRVYSSGMQMRLAFSVATCVRPDILIVDEALAVGDVYFQQKCFDRIRDFTASGTTLLFVSHSMGTVMNICNRCLYIRQGALAFDGAPKAAADRYQAELLGRLDHAPQQHTVAVSAAERLRDAPVLTGSDGSITTPLADCVGVAFVRDDGTPEASIIADQPVRLRVEYRAHRELDDPHVGFKIRNRYGVVLFETNTYCMREQPGPVAAGGVLSASFAFTMALAPDEYTLTVGLGNGGYDEGSFREVLNYLHEVSTFVVLPNSAAITWSGLANLAPRLDVDKL
ncbi:ABC transporter ATP-binding protein [Duganella sp. LX20W]|uniref:ABC transporter ATP-binding protein n=1 Tax=Rugamonas brunnea TaxID=2758569 RepID=A0A7W2IDX5_9BURK|nr:ABC transporter ATP-binding protein [Rugamonas brunnea]MBA5640016.1 ABC transporter ATP-binding protein [Rugamonas brunnea]